MRRHRTHTVPGTYWSFEGTAIYSQTDDSHIASCDYGTVSPGVNMAALIAAAPEMLDAIEAALAYVSTCSFRDSEEVRALRRTLKAARRAARCKS